MSARIESDPAKRKALAADMNFSVLKRTDASIVNVLSCATHVAMYELLEEHNQQQWKRCDIEGSLFVVERDISHPNNRDRNHYRIVITNRKNLNNYHDDLIVGNEDLELNQSTKTIMYSNSKNVTVGIWFYELKDAQVIFDLMKSIVNGQTLPTIKDAAPVTTSTPITPTTVDVKPNMTNNQNNNPGNSANINSRPKRPARRQQNNADNNSQNNARNRRAGDKLKNAASHNSANRPNTAKNNNSSNAPYADSNNYASRTIKVVAPVRVKPAVPNSRNTVPNASNARDENVQQPKDNQANQPTVQQPGKPGEKKESHSVTNTSENQSISSTLSAQNQPVEVLATAAPVVSQPVQSSGPMPPSSAPRNIPSVNRSVTGPAPGGPGSAKTANEDPKSVNGHLEDKPNMRNASSNAVSDQNANLSNPNNNNNNDNKSNNNNGNGTFEMNGLGPGHQFNPMAAAMNGGNMNNEAPMVPEALRKHSIDEIQRYMNHMNFHYPASIHSMRNPALNNSNNAGNVMGMNPNGTNGSNANMPAPGPGPRFPFMPHSSSPPVHPQYAMLMQQQQKQHHDQLMMQRMMMQQQHQRAMGLGPNPNIVSSAPMMPPHQHQQQQQQQIRPNVNEGAVNNGGMPMLAPGVNGVMPGVAGGAAHNNPQNARVPPTGTQAGGAGESTGNPAATETNRVKDEQQHQIVRNDGAGQKPADADVLANSISMAQMNGSINGTKDLSILKRDEFRAIIQRLLTDRKLFDATYNSYANVQHTRNQQ